MLASRVPIYCATDSFFASLEGDVSSFWFFTESHLTDKCSQTLTCYCTVTFPDASDAMNSILKPFVLAKKIVALCRCCGKVFRHKDMLSYSQCG